MRALAARFGQMRLPRGRNGRDVKRCRGPLFSPGVNEGSIYWLGLGQQSGGTLVSLSADWGDGANSADTILAPTLQLTQWMLQGRSGTMATGYNSAAANLQR